MNYRIISIGALGVHELWERQGEARTPHTTTTLVTVGDRRILVDPGLPPQVLAARLAERAGLEAGDISDVFLTNFNPAHRMGLDAFAGARWLIAQAEREAIGQALVARFQQETQPQAQDVLKREIALLKKFTPAPDKLAPGVDLFPLPGYTPGTCGLILSQPRTTIMIAGEAVATAEHLEQGRILRGAADTERARESLREVIEIADAIVPGYDNVILNPIRQR